MEYEYKISEIRFNNGTSIKPRRLTVFIGPNNAGKTRALKDILALTTTSNEKGTVISSVSVVSPQTISDVKKYGVDFYSEDGRWNIRTLGPQLINEFRTPIPPGSNATLEMAFSMFRDSRRIGSALTAFLQTEDRLRLVKLGPPASNFHETASLLQVLYKAGSDATRHVSGIVKKAFDKEIYLDFSVPGRLLLRIGDDFSHVPPDPRDAMPILERYEHLDDQGDGIRSFVGLTVALAAVKRGLFLIDEPEAFMHPPQAFRIGMLIAEHALRSGQTMLATHSTDLLRGILSCTSDVDIIRIDRIENTNHFNSLDASTLSGVIRDPLLSSARVLDGLFYSGVIVVEADSDARFYQAALSKMSPELDFHFVNADNKQTVPTILEFYRKMGVRAAGIVDFDVLNDRKELQRSLEVIGLSNAESIGLLGIQQRIGQAVKEGSPNERISDLHARFDRLRALLEELDGKEFYTPEEERRAKDSLLSSVERAFREAADSTKPWRFLKQRGRQVLPPEVQPEFDSLWQACAYRGLFINPIGELESMLTAYGIESTTDKKAWIHQALKLVPGLAPDENKNPWSFLRRVVDHILQKSKIGQDSVADHQ